MSDNADSYAPCADWIPYAEAKRRVLSGLPVEVLDPYAPEWRVVRFSAHRPLRHYRIPPSPPTRYDLVPELRKGQAVRILDIDGNPELTFPVPTGTWRVSLIRIA